MSVGSKLKTALTAAGLPMEQDQYAGTATTYLTFNYWTVPIWYKDDTPEYEQVSLQVHLFAPLTTNLNTLIAQIKLLLVAGGYAYPVVNNLTDQYSRHIVFDTETREAV